MIRRRVVYSGRVQGVGFRATAQWLARARQVSGWVRNEPDGTVLLEVQGTQQDLEDYLNALRRELGRNILREDASDAAPMEDERGFEVRH